VFTLHRGCEDNKSLKYWQGRLPCAAQVQNCVIAIYNIPDLPPPGPPTQFPAGSQGNAAPSPAPSEEIVLPYTVAAFPRQKFDAVIEELGWILARKGKGYIAFRSQQPVTWTSDFVFDTEGLIARGRQNVYICQLGREATDGDFEEWCHKITSSKVICEDLSVTYDAPGLGEIHFGWEETLTCEEQELSLRNYPRFDNPYCHTAYNSGAYDIRFQD